MAAQSSNPGKDAPAPWYAAYPAPKCTVGSLPREDLLQWLRTGKVGGKDFVLVDVRRADFEVYFHRKKVWAVPG